MKVLYQNVYGIFILGETGSTLSYSGILVVISINMVKPLQSLMNSLKPTSAAQSSKVA
jgi:hypothetical protein